MKYLLQLDKNNIVISKTTTDADFSLSSDCIFVSKYIYENAKLRFTKYINETLENVIPVDHIDDNGLIRPMTIQEKIDAGLESIDTYRNDVIKSIVNEMNEREKPLLAPYSKGQQLSFSTRKKEAIGWNALLSADKTIDTAQTNYSMLYRIVTIENGIVTPIADDITNAANSIIEKVNLFEQTLTALSSKKDALIGKPEVLDVNNVVVQPASGVYALTVDELINYGDVKTKWDSI